MSSTRIVRTFALSALVGLFALSGCVFHSSSGSSTSRPSSSGYSSSGGKPIQHSSSSSSGKPISKGSNSGSGKSISKGDNGDDNVDKPPVEDEPAKRTKPAERTKPSKPPQRTKPAERTPTEPVDGDAKPTTIKAKTKTVDPASNDRLVAPQHSSRTPTKAAPTTRVAAKPVRTTTLVRR
jgi:hypothetical protein